MFGAVLHGHEGLPALVFNNGCIGAALQRLQEFTADKTVVARELITRPEEPLPKLGIPAFLYRGKIDNYDKHDDTSFTIFAVGPNAKTGLYRYDLRA
jgi:hypothetical protein